MRINDYIEVDKKHTLLINKFHSTFSKHVHFMTCHMIFYMILDLYQNSKTNKVTSHDYLYEEIVINRDSKFSKLFQRWNIKTLHLLLIIALKNKIFLILERFSSFSFHRCSIFKRNWKFLVYSNGYSLKWETHQLNK